MIWTHRSKDSLRAIFGIRKVKESKGKESKHTVFTNPNIKKEDSASAEKSADADKIFVSKKNKKQVSTRLFWQDFIDSWRGFYVQKFPGEEPIFEAQWMAKIYDRLLWRSEKIGKNWTKEYALSAMQFFLQKAHEDDWLRKHFSLKNLNEQLGAVFARAADKKKPVPVIDLPSFEKDLKYLVEQYSDGNFNHNLITTDYYDKMVARSILPMNYLYAIYNSVYWIKTD